MRHKNHPPTAAIMIPLCEAMLAAAEKMLAAQNRPEPNMQATMTGAHSSENLYLYYAISTDMDFICDVRDVAHAMSEGKARIEKVSPLTSMPTGKPNV